MSSFGFHVIWLTGHCLQRNGLSENTYLFTYKALKNILKGELKETPPFQRQTIVKEKKILLKILK